MHELDEYQSNALQTAVYPLERALDYTVLGLLSEVGELAEVYYNAKKDAWSGGQWAETDLQAARSENGDNFWYLAAIADALGTTLGQLKENSFGVPELRNSRGLTIIQLQIEAGAMAGIVKKAIRDNGGTLSAGKVADLKSGVLNVLALLDHFAELLGTTGTRVRQGNILKLADRKERGVLGGSGNAR